MGKDKKINLSNSRPISTNRDLLKNKLLKLIGCCENCGYNKFPEILELAHIIHGNTYDKINSKNMFLLCPNCHRLFDYGFILVKGVKSKSVKTKFFENLDYKKPKELYKRPNHCRWFKNKTKIVKETWKKDKNGVFKCVPESKVVNFTNE